MKKTKNKKIIFSSIVLLSIFSFSNVFAESYILDGKKFYVGVHNPKKKKKEENLKKRVKITSHLEEYEAKKNQLKNSLSDEELQKILPNIKTDKYPIELESGAHVTIGGVWTNASSRNFKENIKKIDENLALDTVLDLEPVTYNYKIQPNEVYAGFIAEDVPNLVATSDRASLSPMDIVSVVVGAVKKIWNTITEILFRLDRIEKKLGIESQNNKNFEKKIENKNKDEKNKNNSSTETEPKTQEENKDNEAKNETEEKDKNLENQESTSQENSENKSTENEEAENSSEMEENTEQTEEIQEENNQENTENQSVENNSENNQETTEENSEVQNEIETEETENKAVEDQETEDIQEENQGGDEEDLIEKNSL